MTKQNPMAEQTCMSLGSVVGGVRDFLSSGVTTALSVGNTVCVQIPKRTVIVCFEVQKRLLFLPFRCLGKMYAVVEGPVIFVLGRGRHSVFPRNVPTAMEVLTGMREPTNGDVMTAIREVRSTAMQAACNAESCKSQLCSYKQKLEAWKQDSEKKTEALYKSGLEDKELMKGVASTLRYLRMLKVKRSKLNESFDDTISTMINSGSLSAEKLLALQKNFRNIDATMKEKRTSCLNFLLQGNVKEDIAAEILSLSSSPKNKQSPTPSLVNGQNQSLEMVQKVVNLVADENVYLKSRLSLTHEKMEQVLVLSQQIQGEVGRLGEQFAKMAALNEEMVNLQIKLQEGQVLLQNVQEDRDQMKAKLNALEAMIKEEEDFLGDSTFESGFEDSGYTLDDLSSSTA